MHQNKTEFQESLRAYKHERTQIKDIFFFEAGKNEPQKVVGCDPVLWLTTHIFQDFLFNNRMISNELFQKYQLEFLRVRGVLDDS